MEITTDKEAFEFVYNSLMEQDHRSIALNHDCAYRGYNSTLVNSIFENAVYEAAAKGIGYDNPDFRSYEEMAYETIYEELAQDSKCALGFLIKDEFYYPELEGKSIADVFSEDSITEIEFAIFGSNPNWKTSAHSVLMLARMQKIHDTVDPGLWSSSHYGFGKMRNDFDENGNYTPKNVED